MRTGQLRAVDERAVSAAAVLDRDAVPRPTMMRAWLRETLAR